MMAQTSTLITNVLAAMEKRQRWGHEWPILCSASHSEQLSVFGVGSPATQVMNVMSPVL